MEIVLPKLGVQFSHNLPVFKYLSLADDPVVSAKLSTYVTEVRAKGTDYWISKSMRKTQRGKAVPQSIEEIRGSNDCKTAKGAQQALNDLVFVPSSQIDLDLFRNLLVEIYERFDPIQNRSEQAVTTQFRKAVRIYDWLRYGNKKTPKVPKGTEAD